MIFRVRNPAVLGSAPVVDLFKRAYAKHPLKTPYTDALQGLLPNISHPATAVFIAEENGELQGLAICFIPTTKFYPCPQVNYFYNEGSSAARQDLLKEIVEFVTEAGYNRWWFICGAGPWEAYDRMGKDFGVVHPIGTLAEMELGVERQPVRKPKHKHRKGVKHRNSGKHDARRVRRAAKSNRGKSK